MSKKQLMTLIFSAKECFFKAVFHQVKEYFDFKVVSIISLNEQTGQLILASDVALSEVIKPGKSFVVYYELLNFQHRRYIITALHEMV